MQDIKLGIIETGFIHPVIEKCVRKEDMGDKVMSNLHKITDITLFYKYHHQLIFYFVNHNNHVKRIQ